MRHLGRFQRHRSAPIRVLCDPVRYINLLVVVVVVVVVVVAAAAAAVNIIKVALLQYLLQDHRTNVEH